MPNYDELYNLVLESKNSNSSIIKNTVEVCGTVAKITKGKYSVIITFNKSFTIIIADKEKIEGEPFILLAREFTNPSDAYEKWCKLIGKMCKKEINSKYFGQRRKNEHLNNGTFNKKRSDEILELAKSVIDTFA